jgi:predicted metal-dependent phosphoesterase TrpH
MIDLHVHSTFSDGTLTPAELLAEAEAAGLTALALTDHDTVSGLPEFQAAAEPSPVRAVPGVEISAEHSGGAMHILGYFMDPDHPGLQAELHRIQAGRDARNRQMLEKINRLGYELSFDEVSARAGQEIIGRPHFADALIERGVFKNRKEAFRTLLARGARGYVTRYHPTPAECIRLIRAAGGAAVLAHPVTLRLSRGKLRTLVSSLKTVGLAGMEVYYPEHNAGQLRVFEQVARQLRLVRTGGSDYHGAGTPDLKIGRGFGALNVPDRTVEKLLRRCPGSDRTSD